MTNLEWAVDRLRYAADVWSATEVEAAQEYARLRATGQSTWDAQRGTDERLAPRLRRAQAEYEIALAELRRASRAD